MATSPLQNAFVDESSARSPIQAPRFWVAIQQAFSSALTIFRGMGEAYVWAKHMEDQAKARWPHIVLED